MGAIDTARAEQSWVDAGVRDCRELRSRGADPAHDETKDSAGGNTDSCSLQAHVPRSSSEAKLHPHPQKKSSRRTTARPHPAAERAGCRLLRSAAAITAPALQLCARRAGI